MPKENILSSGKDAAYKTVSIELDVPRSDPYYWPVSVVFLKKCDFCAPFHIVKSCQFRNQPTKC
jgi:hypothetical protein